MLVTPFDDFAKKTKLPLLVQWGSKEMRWVMMLWGAWLGDCPELQCLTGELPGQVQMPSTFHVQHAADVGLQKQ